MDVRLSTAEPLSPIRRVIKGAHHGVRRVLRDRQGATAVMAGLAFTVLVGFAGLATDAASWQVTKSSMQGAADRAAYSAAIALKAGSNLTTEAKGVSAQLGFVDGQGGTVVTVNNPPLSGSHAGDSGGVEVVISQPLQMWFSSMFLASSPVASARAVAAAGSVGACLLVLDPSAPKALSISGNGTLNMPCDIYVNSTDSTDTELSGSASVVATNIYLGGGYKTSGAASISATGALKTDSTPIADPYAGRVMPKPGNCGLNPTDSSGGNTGTYTVPKAATTINPGVYCGGISVGGGSGQLTMNPGVYFIVNNGNAAGDFNVSGSGAVSATGGVTIILTSKICGTWGALPSSPCNSIGKFTVSGSGDVSITAPSTGPTAGMAVWVDQNAPTNNQVTLSGGSKETINGAGYAPSQIVSYSGGSNAGPSCTQLVGRTVTLSGGAQLSHDCSGIGLSEPTGSGPLALVE